MEEEKKRVRRRKISRGWPGLGRVERTAEKVMKKEG